MHKSQENFIKELEKIGSSTFSNFEGKDPTDYWVALIDGKRVSMHNGKSLWHAKNHVGAAIVAHFDGLNNIANLFEKHFKYGTGNWNYKYERIGPKKIYFYQWVITQWKEKHFEAITLTEWIKRGCP